MLPTQSLAAVFVFSFLVGFGAVVTPGPVSTAIVSQAPRRGWQVGPLLATGHFSLEGVLVVLIVLGLGFGLAHPVIQTWISLLGGLLLFWMGLRMAYDTWLGRVHLPTPESEPEPLSYSQMLGLGAIATISNPFWYAWWVTVGAGYLSQAKALSIAAIAAFFFGHATADLLWDSFLSAVIGAGRRWFTDRAYRFVIIACGLFFIYLGGSFFLHGLAEF